MGLVHPGPSHYYIECEVCDFSTSDQPTRREAEAEAFALFFRRQTHARKADLKKVDRWYCYNCSCERD